MCAISDRLYLRRAIFRIVMNGH